MPRHLARWQSGTASAILRYVLAIACSAVIVAATPLFADSAHGVVFSIPIAAIALLALGLGPGPGLLAAVATGIGIWFFFQTPRNSFALESPREVVHLAAYFVASLTVVGATELRQRAQRRLASTLAKQRNVYEQLDALTEAMPQFVWITRPDGHVDYINRRWMDYTGMDADELNRCKWHSLVHPEDLPLVMQPWKEALETRGARDMAFRYRGANGAYRWFSVTMAPLSREDGEVIRWIGTATDIDERKEAERRLRVVLEASPMGVGLGDITGGILVSNDAYLKLLGYSREQLARGELRWNRLTPAEYRDKDRRAIEQALERGTSDVYEKEYERPDGSRVPVLIAIASLGSGELAAFAIDISDRKRAEEAARQSEALARQRLAELETLYETAPIGLGVFDENLRFVRVNKVLAGFTGKPLPEHVGKTPTEVGPSDVAQQMEDALRGVVRTGERIDLEMSGASSAQPGVQRTWSEHWVPIKDPSGRVIGVSGAAEDITDRKRSEEALRESEERFKAFAETIPHIALIVDPSGRLTYSNNRFFEYSGMDHTQVKEAALAADSPLIHPDDWERTRDVWRAGIRDGGPFQMECRLRRYDGEYRWHVTHVAPVRDSSGKISMWVGTSSDVHEQRVAALALQNANEQLLEADRRKNDFLAVLSHELRNPLAPIRNSVYILERAVAGEEQARRARQVIDRQVEHMTRLIDDLLDVTRISRGKITLHRERLDLRPLVRSTAEDHRELFARSGVQLVIQNSGPALYVDGDRVRLAQAIGNLLNNAIKFTPRDGKAELSVEETSDGHASVRVRDTGAGMSKETLDHLFEPFMQADQTLDRSRGGLGLGLALVKGLAELHGGTISAQSEGVGKGSEFALTLPLLQAPAKARLSVVPAPVRTERARKVLVIEDNTDAAESLREVLELGEHEVAVAYTGPEGVESAHTFKPDIVLCDIGLPGLDGYGVARAIRSDPALKSTYLVALSGYALQEDVARAKEAGFDRHMAKPADMAALEQLLADAETRATVG